MIRAKRQQCIIDLIEENDIETQDELVTLLTERGFCATQATVSRDIKELGLIKILGADKKYKYVKAEAAPHKISVKFGNIFKECVLSIQYANNLIVIKTVAGGANSASTSRSERNSCSGEARCTRTAEAAAPQAPGCWIRTRRRAISACHSSSPVA